MTKSEDPAAFLNLGTEYLKAAHILYQHGMKELWHKGPINHASFHAIELFLKGAVLCGETTAKTLQKRNAHNVHLLAQRAKAEGLQLDARVLSYLEMIADMGTGTRYLHVDNNFAVDPETLIETATEIYGLCATYMKARYDSTIVVAEWPKLVSPLPLG
jgi:hypothetical protein